MPRTYAQSAGVVDSDMGPEVYAQYVECLSDVALVNLERIGVVQGSGAARRGRAPIPFPTETT